MSSKNKGKDEAFEKWRKAQIASLVRTGHMPAARAFEELGSIHWMAWQCAWDAALDSVVIELPAGASLPQRMCGPQSSPNCPLLERRAVVAAIEAAGLKVSE